MLPTLLTYSSSLFIALFLTIAKATEHWGYHGKGEDLDPRHWAAEYPACGRHHQSPINFDSLTVVEDSELRPLIFVDYDEQPPGRAWNFQNNGHTVVISANYSCPPQVQGGALGTKYQFMQLHFHWGHEDYHGSEHHIDGRQYPLEMHIVHKRRNEAMEAIQQDEIGMAVVGVFFELGNVDNKHLSPITEALAQVASTNGSQRIPLPTFTLKSLLPTNPDYFRYNGSLTTPPCNQIVQWSVMRAPVRVSRRQLEAFRNLHRVDASYEPNAVPIYIDKNYRPVQPVGDRKVFRFRSGYVPPYYNTGNAMISNLCLCLSILGLRGFLGLPGL